jgi:molybdenum cofactor synthesis domain-containing protein
MEKPVVKATILAVGTELTQGQIINSNASQLSQWLTDLGFEVIFHLTVPDDEAGINSGLKHCADASELMFVTGGLGPTTDDFTRNIVASWLGLPLEFDVASWARIQEMIQRRGGKLALTNRQQCYFPRGSDILVNSAGTANGFRHRFGGKEVWVLPGPPEEIRRIWQDHIASELASRIPLDERLDLQIWSCMGISEAELGESIQNALLGCPYQIGYRAHSPLIDVKLWVPRRASEAAKAWIEKLEKVVEPWLVSTGGIDLAKIFLDAIPDGFPVDIHDVATGGLVSSRLSALISGAGAETSADRFSFVTQWDKPIDFEGWMIDVLKLSDPGSLTFAVCGPSARGEWAIGYSSGGEIHVDTHNLQLRPELIKMRGHRYVAELAFIKWRRILEGDA